MLPAKKEFIEFMLDAGVLRFGEFTLKSGRISPYFVNTGLYKTGAQINRLGSFYAALIKEVCGDAFDAMFGPAYKGIPLATAAAAALAREQGTDRPFFFNRKEVKDHGEGGSIVGYQPADGDRVIIIEDVITSGKALRESIPVLASCGDLTVRDMFISVDRCEKGLQSEKTAVMEVFDEFGITVHAIVTAMDLCEYLREDGGYGDVLARMEAYLAQYCRG